MRWGRIILIDLIIVLMLVSLGVDVLPVQASADVVERAPEVNTSVAIPEDIEEVVDFLLETVTSEIHKLEEQGNRVESPLLKWGLKSLQKLISLLFVSLLIAWLFPNILTRPLAALKEKTGRSIGVGAMIFFLVPIALVVLAGVTVLLVFLCSLVEFNYLAGSITLFGLGILLILIVGYIFLLGILSKAIIGLWLGQQFLSIFKKDLEEKVVLCMLVGGFIIAILVKIPWVGWGFSFIIDLVGIGAFWLSLRQKRE